MVKKEQVNKLLQIAEEIDKANITLLTKKIDLLEAFNILMLTDDPNTSLSSNLLQRLQDLVETSSALISNYISHKEHYSLQQKYLKILSALINILGQPNQEDDILLSKLNYILSFVNEFS